MTLARGMQLGRYEILAPLGKGGMGEVYRAKDTQLGREVAIKVLPQHLAENPHALKRFEKEARAVAALSHSNILEIHDSGIDQGIAYAVMELLEGETLRARLGGSAIPWRKALEIAVAVADGLAAAHTKGVIHRDLKPDNIFLMKDGRIKILDFGLARWTPIVSQEEITEAPTKSQVTELGAVIGTVPYMSPEQAQGDPLDARSDIFSLGSILYEMVAGKRPFSGKSPAETMAAILRDDPPRLVGLPPEVQRVIERCLEKNPDQRFHSAHDLAFALKDTLNISGSGASQALATRPIAFRKVWIIAIVFAVIAIAVGSWRIMGKKAPAGLPLQKIESLAVLPLKNLSGDPKQEYFADGMTEELIAKLSRISALRVISRTSVMEYKGAHKKSLPEIAKELNVDTILEGSVLHSGDRVRITAQLIYAPTDRHLWGESYERDMSDILALQNEIASAVAHEIRLKLMPQEQAELAAAITVNPAAYEAYLRGLSHMRFWPTEEEAGLGITMFERAIEIDPNFARAYTELSMAHSWMYHAGYDHTADRLIKAKRAFDHAFKLQPNLPEAHLALGFYHYWGFKNYDQAIHEFSIAQKAIPNDELLLTGLALIHKRRGNFKAALQGFKKTLQLHPRGGTVAVEIGLVYNTIGEYTEAQRYFDLAISLEPDDSSCYTAKVDNYLKWTGDTKGARVIIMKIPDENVRNAYLHELEILNRNYETALALLPLALYENYANAIFAGDCYQWMNQPAKSRTSYETARTELEKLLKDNPQDEYLHSWISIAYAGLNRKEEAIREAQTAVELLPVSKDAVTGPRFVQNFAIVYVMVGEYESALDQIEYLLSIPTLGNNAPSVPILRIHPRWDPLRSHPRFQKLLESS